LGALSGIFIVSNDQNYQDFRKAYLASIDTDSATVPTIPGETGPFSSAALLNGRNYYRRNRDLSVILAVIAYGLNVMEANVGAHLNNFDISDDLSLNWQPNVFQISQTGVIPAPGLTLNFRLKAK
jgi:hypothetical protein